MDIYQIFSIIILDNNGKRLCSLFYEPIGEPEKIKFEKEVFEKSKGSNCELDIIQNRIIIGSKQSDVWVYVVGKSLESNELILLDVLNVLISLFKKACTNNETVMVTKKLFLENFSTIKLYIDEVVADGVVFETDEDTILNRVPLQDQALNDLQTGIELVKEKFSLSSLYSFTRS
ncbi:hypothetical protein DICPUDRAFT_80104 [Dictyostelium purpureum]|uniref:AP complex mu/sigma subunit domain-containing protein n=1 Tax=Dictyostelium purpureum TaxID=5786 RepID=F0ZPJ6_DICPU|nr:uncharacterized protein DICPUDRAFT_80104 [Dictyostelium purpureum]EGC34134.1 hypothetical protein DICPUDRAFT_80104 [Dictyostelium purpureum]|eukprot:XP_003289332.1 hypothetical protein DICPUDRAFT_80104 [Dictyostelium purpureum]